MKEIAKYADWLFYVSLVGLILAAYGAFAGRDLWLAPTQWIMVSTAVVVYALYLKHAE
jgi:uncharacterized membrane protein